MTTETLYVVGLYTGLYLPEPGNRATARVLPASRASFAAEVHGGFIEPFDPFNTYPTEWAD